ncbi:MAG: hypothetical protein H6709_03805 [Kofleriaceae bacterium]|nr:hypothetical protein [Myxococcales bacterium]MCB9560240.1 hypothetical protein [Kofleriaceae bacterium]MCB9571195.1 hypothetical protein [Kofleriaceae bacterium]
MLADAHKTGALSTATMKTLDVVDLGAQIQAGLGVAVDDVASSEVVLVTMMPDDSGSIAGSGNEAAVRDGHNLVLDALTSSKQAGDVFVHTRYLNGQVLFPYVSIDAAVPMDRGNYRADKGTPLYDQTVVLLGTVIAKAQEFAQAGVPVRTVTLLITDGADAGSRRCKASHVAALVEDLRRQENHVVAAMGISDGHTDFHKVFRAMGIPDAWILTPGNTASEIRKAFRVFSQSAIAATGGAAVTALGGFAN